MINIYTHTPLFRRAQSSATSILAGSADSERARLSPPAPLQKLRSAASLRGLASMMSTVTHNAPATFVERDEQIVDTRTPSPLHNERSTNGAADHYQPDHSTEVAMLSAKLVNAINYQASLDDSLQQAHHDLEQARQELTSLREYKSRNDELIKSGTFVRASEVEMKIAEARAQMLIERASRETAEKAKKQTDAELEALTVSLFEEANTMVAAARRDTEASEKRNSQLRKELADTESLLASQQEQLQDLKATLEKLERSVELDSVAIRESSMPTTPIHSNIAHFDSLQFSPTPHNPSPDHPLRFTNFLQPIMRHDITSYTDFLDLMSVARLYRTQPHSRSGSNHTAASSSSQTNLPLAVTSSPSLPGAFSFTTSSPSNSSAQLMGPALKDSKFYKRTLIEDLEPTLRLDLAPGLSFLSRRSVMSAVLQGNLGIEPFMQQGAQFACALCGEARKVEPYIRKYRFRTSEEDSAQRYPLCDYCLNRVRSTGDFVAFLRIVRDGHWRCDSEAEQKSAWDECVRLREKMFWARLGGGVVPAVAAQLRRDGGSVTSTAARPSLEDVPEVNRDDDSLRTSSLDSARIAGAAGSPSISISAPEDYISQKPLDSKISSDDASKQDDPSTPFEDARDSLEVPGREDQPAAQPSSSARDGQDGSVADQTIPPVRTPGSSPPRTPLSRKSLSPSPTRPAERGRSPETIVSSASQPSGVLARVRAMEAKSQSYSPPSTERRPSYGSTK